MHPYKLETDRLILRALVPEDAPSAYVWLSDSFVNRYVRYPLYSSIQDAQAWLASVTDNPCEFGFVRKNDSLLIGCGGVFPAGGNGSVWEIGYNLRRDCWGQGFATEASQALLSYARDVHGIHHFIGKHAKENLASGRVLEHCGFVYDHDDQAARFDGSEVFQVKCYRLYLD